MKICTHVQASACEADYAHMLLLMLLSLQKKDCWVFRTCIVLQHNINTRCAGFVNPSLG